jgi:gliding motility-associatede transport system auxiliary component
MSKNWLTARQTKYTGYASLYIVIILAVLAIVNFLGNRHNKSVDTTENKRFSLSDQTEKVVGNLASDVKITVYDQTSRFAPAKDLLDRYSNLSPKLSIDYIDPDKNPQIAQAAGITSFGTIRVNSGMKQEEAKSVTEEEITNAIIRSLKSDVRTVCAVQGSGEKSFDDSERTGYSAFKELLEKSNYATRTISLLESPSVPGDCTILLVGGPRFDYVGPVVTAIKDYVEKGGSAMLLLDPPLRLGQDAVGENREMASMLAGWGVVLNNDLVLDQSDIGALFGLGPASPLVVSYETHAIVRDLREVATAFPLTRTVDTGSGEGITVEKLFSSSGNAYATTKIDSAEIEIDPSVDKRGPFNLAVAGTIAVDGAVPPPAAGEEGEEPEAAPASGEGRFVVVGSSGWVGNNILRFNGNRDLSLNMMNWLSSDEDLISIRPKEPENRPLTLTLEQMFRVFLASVIFLPLLVILSGVSVWWKRR